MTGGQARVITSVSRWERFEYYSGRPRLVTQVVSSGEKLGRFNACDVRNFMRNMAVGRISGTGDVHE